MSREKMNIQYRIRAVDNFTKTHNKFHRQLTNIKRHVESIDNNKTIEFDANINKFTRKVRRVREDLAKINDNNVDIDVNSAEALIDLSKIERAVESINNNISVLINVVGDRKAKRDLNKVGRRVDRLQRKNILIQIRTNSQEALQSFRGFMGKIARLSRDAGELFTSMFGSALMASAPALAASLWSAVGAVGALGPMVGALSGGAMGLVTAFGAAGIGIAGFTGLAVSSLSDVFSVNKELNELKQELNDTTDEEARLEIIAEMEKLMESLTGEQKRALKSVQNLSSTWKKLSDRLEPKVIDTFVSSMSALETVIERLAPMMGEVAHEAAELADMLKLNIDSKDFRKFIDFLNKSAAPIMSDIIQGLGNFTMGIVNMLTAFGPLAEEVAEGFNTMGREFREWADGLSESEKFQKFMEYIREEAPKLLSIFGGLIVGLVDLFAAFGPLASDMLDGLLDMVDGFKEWASTLDENEGFQNFIQFVRDNGPELLDFFGELREFLVNIIEGFAKASEHMTPFITRVLEIMNAFMDANPWLMEFVGILSTLIGIAMLVYVPLRLLWSVLRILLTPIILVVGWIVKHFIPALQKLWEWIDKYILPVFKKVWDWAMKYLVPAFQKVWEWAKKWLGPIIKWLWDQFKKGNVLKRVGGFLLRFLGPLGIVAIAVIEFAGFIRDSWDDIKKWTKKKWGEITDFLEGLEGTFERAGGNVIDGFKRGLEKAKDGMMTSVTSIFNTMVNNVYRTLDINSPSKVFRAIGMSTGEGFVAGIIKMTGAVAKASAKIVDAAIPSMTPNLEFQGISTATSRRMSDSSNNEIERDNGERERIIVEVPLYANGKEIARATVDDMEKLINERKNVRKRKPRRVSVVV